MKGSNIEEAQALLKQYKMFSKALNFIEEQKDKDDICSEMDKLELRILDLTNLSYEREFRKILEEETSFLKEERLKLQRLVDVITSRVNYVNLALKRHKLSTGRSLSPYAVSGEDILEEYKNSIRIIDKYKENLRNKADLAGEVKALDLKISSAMDRIEANKKANSQLELKMITLLRKVFDRYSCKDLVERRKEIDLAYEELGYSLDKARENVRVAKLGNSSDIIMECDNMLSSITLEYEKYKEKKYILELMDVYKDEASDYESLLAKRENINDILKNISNSDVYKDINEELKKQFNTIKLEQQDIDTYNSLCEDKKRKTDLISEIDRENNSEEFNKVLDVFLKNEKKYREELYLEQQKKEYAERQKKLLRDKEIQDERNRRQKLIEEERNRDIEKRTRELLKEKQKTFDDSALKSREVSTTRLQRNSEVMLNSATNNGGNYVGVTEKPRVVTVNNSSNDMGIPVIKNDKLTSKVVKEEDTFFNNKEIEELNSSNSGENKGSWF